MRGLTPRERILLSLVLVAIIGVVFYLLVWTPRTAERSRLTSQLASKQAEVERLQRLADTREEREREFQALADRIRLIEAKLPPAREIPNLIRQLQATAQEIGVKLNLLRPGQNQPGGGPAAQPPAGQPRPAQPAQPVPPAQPAQPVPPAQPQYMLFRLDLAYAGTYAGLMSLLSRLEDFPRFIVLRQISMAPEELPRLRATISAETYVLPEQLRATP
ncbi:MAG: type 4a pilus biogenesis protein PilO [Armatimonadota bacterium]|nr:type 4a pilus biogenesis protein PilO [Armatimonadota bacterium]